MDKTGHIVQTFHSFVIKIISINKVLDVKLLVPLFIKKYANSLTNRRYKKLMVLVQPKYRPYL